MSEPGKEPPDRVIGAIVLVAVIILFGLSVRSTQQGWPTGASPFVPAVNADMSCTAVNQVIGYNGSILACMTDPASALVGTTGSLGGGLLAAGGCTTTTVNVTGATTDMAVVVSPAGGVNPGSGAQFQGRVSSAGVVTVTLCALVLLTPPATTYNVRVIP